MINALRVNETELVGVAVNFSLVRSDRDAAFTLQKSLKHLLDDAGVLTAAAHYWRNVSAITAAAHE